MKPSVHPYHTRANERHRGYHHGRHSTAQERDIADITKTPPRQTRSSSKSRDSSSSSSGSFEQPIRTASTSPEDAEDGAFTRGKARRILVQASAPAPSSPYIKVGQENKNQNRPNSRRLSPDKNEGSSHSSSSSASSSSTSTLPNPKKRNAQGEQKLPSTEEQDHSADETTQVSKTQSTPKAAPSQSSANVDTDDAKPEPKPHHRLSKCPVKYVIGGEIVQPGEESSFDLREAPVFYPTEEQFANPTKFMEMIQPVVEEFGICRVVPPAAWNKDAWKMRIDPTTFSFNTKVQSVHTLQNRYGRFTKFIAQLQFYHTSVLRRPLQELPRIDGIAVDLYLLHRLVQQRGGYHKMMGPKNALWSALAQPLHLNPNADGLGYRLSKIYQYTLWPFDEFIRDGGVPPNYKVSPIPPSWPKVARDLYPGKQNPPLSDVPYGGLPIDAIRPSKRQKKEEDENDDQKASPTAILPKEITGWTARALAAKKRGALEDRKFGPYGHVIEPATKKQAGEWRKVRANSFIPSLDPHLVVCITCGKGDNPELLVLCDSHGCSGGQHTYCMDPPRKSAPRGDWFCADCRGEGDSDSEEEDETSKNASPSQRASSAAHSSAPKPSSSFKPHVPTSSPTWRKPIKRKRLYSSKPAKQKPTEDTSSAPSRPTSPPLDKDDEYYERTREGREEAAQERAKDLELAEALGFGHGVGKRFTLAEFEEQALQMATAWFCDLNKCNPSAMDVDEPTEGGNRKCTRKALRKERMPQNPLVTHPEIIEAEYWRIVGDPNQLLQVLYGSDVDVAAPGACSFFPLDVDGHTVGDSCPDRSRWQTHARRPHSTQFPRPTVDYLRHSGWNLNSLPYVTLFKHLGESIAGVSRPMLYVGMVFSTFSWHTEDNWLFSINYIHTGAPKRWYGIASGDAERFEKALREELPHLFKAEPQLLYQLATVLHPEIIKRHGIAICTTLQHEGEFVITMPRSYHSGFNCGFNVAESVNFATPFWLDWGLAAVNQYRFVRSAVFAHEKMVWKAACDSGRFDSLNLAISIRQQLQLYQDYAATAIARLAEQGVTKIFQFTKIHIALKMNGYGLPYDVTEVLDKDLHDGSHVDLEDKDGFEPEDPQCTVCGYDLYHHRVDCHCTTPRKPRCLKHATTKICSCRSNSLFISYRYRNSSWKAVLTLLDAVIERLKR